MSLARIKEIVGKDNWSMGKNDILIYSYDASTIKSKPVMVVWPDTEEQVEEIIKLCYKNGINVVPRGAGTGLVGGAVPQKSVVINLTRLNKVKKTGINSVFVQAGITIKELNNHLGLHDKEFPIIPSSYKTCTVGGVISCNAAGKRSIRYGKTIDWVKSLEIIDGKGRKRKIKDYKKFVGAEGLLGIILSAELKTIEKIKETSMDVFYFDNVLGLADKVEQLRNNKKVIEIEVLGKKTSNGLGLGRRYTLMVEYEGNNGYYKEADKIKEFNDLRDSAYPIMASNGYTIIEDPQLELDELKELIRWLEEHKVPFFGHLGVGIIHPCFKSDELIPSFYEKVRKLGGRVTGEHGIGLKKKKYVDNHRKNLLSLYKKSYDPKNILNRRKII